MIRAIVFDFDGTLADSKSVKRDAWRSVFSDRSGADDAVLQHQVDIGIGDRYDILRRTLTLRGVQGMALKKLVDHYADCYGGLVQVGIRKRGLFPGVVQVLDRLHKTYPLYINTTTPDASMRQTLTAFRLTRYFHRRVLGSTSGLKEDNLQRVIHELKLEPSEALMVGDEEGDLAATEAVGARFVGIADHVNRWSVDHFPHPLLKSVTLLESILKHT